MAFDVSQAHYPGHEFTILFSSSPKSANYVKRTTPEFAVSCEIKFLNSTILTPFAVWGYVGNLM
jgi:hypothetical protein